MMQVSQIELRHLMQELINHSEPFVSKIYSEKQFISDFGQDGVIKTPIGEIQMPQNQIEKLISKKRIGYYGLIKPTLTKPLLILPTWDKNNVEAITYVKTFIDKKKDTIYFTSFTKQKNGEFEVISNFASRENQIKEILKKGYKNKLHSYEGITSVSHQDLGLAKNRKPLLVFIHIGIPFTFTKVAQKKQPPKPNKTKIASSEKEINTHHKQYDFIFEAGGSKNYVKTFHSFPVKKGILKGTPSTVIGLYTYHVTDSALVFLQKLYPNNSYGSQNELSSKDLINPNLNTKSIVNKKVTPLNNNYYLLVSNGNKGWEFEKAGNAKPIVLKGFEQHEMFRIKDGNYYSIYDSKTGQRLYLPAKTLNKCIEEFTKKFNDYQKRENKNYDDLIGEQIKKSGLSPRYHLPVEKNNIEKTETPKLKERGVTIINKAQKRTSAKAINRASILEACKDLSKLRYGSAMALNIFYNLFRGKKEGDTVEIKGDFNNKILEKLPNIYINTYSETVVEDTHIELIEKIEARAETLKAKTAGTDLFPELAGITDAFFVFLNAFLQMHNKTVTKEDIIFIVTNLQNAIKNGLIKAKHPLNALVAITQKKLTAVADKLSTGEKIKLNITNKKNIESKILSLNGLGFWNVIASAVVGKAAEIFAQKQIFKKGENANTLSGIDGFVRADNRTEVKSPDTFKLPGQLGKLLQNIQPYKYSIVLTGDPHAGKTEFSMQLVDGFCSIGKTVGAFMLEQGGLESKDTKDAIDRNVSKANQKSLFVTGEAPKGIDTIKECAEKFNVILIDSWQKLGIPSTKFDDLRHQFPNTIFIVVFQQNGDGGTRGGVSADYDTPVHLKVHKVDSTFTNNYVEAKKNRGNSIGFKYMVKAKKTINAE